MLLLEACRTNIFLPRIPFVPSQKFWNWPVKSRLSCKPHFVSVNRCHIMTLSYVQYMYTHIYISFFLSCWIHILSYWSSWDDDDLLFSLFSFASFYFSLLRIGFFPLVFSMILLFSQLCFSFSLLLAFFVIACFSVSCPFSYIHFIHFYWFSSIKIIPKHHPHRSTLFTRFGKFFCVRFLIFFARPDPTQFVFAYNSYWRLKPLTASRTRISHIWPWQSEKIERYHSIKEDIICFLYHYRKKWMRLHDWYIN